MDLFEAIRDRRSIKSFLDKEVPWDNVVTILQAGKFAPSPGNIQNWKFIVVKDDSKRKALAKACLDQMWMEQAPIFIAVIGEPDKAERFYGQRGARMYTQQACGAAIQNMLLAAHGIGLAACWVGAFDETEVWRILGLPEEKTVQAILPVGYAAEIPERPPKKRIEHVMFFEKWWGRLESPKTHIGWWSAYNERMVDQTKKFVKKTADKVKKKVKESKEKKQQEQKK